MDLGITKNLDERPISSPVEEDWLIWPGRLVNLEVERATLLHIIDDDNIM